jgi:hypothetical protein
MAPAYADLVGGSQSRPPFLIHHARARASNQPRAWTPADAECRLVRLLAGEWSLGYEELEARSLRIPYPPPFARSAACLAGRRSCRAELRVVASRDTRPGLTTPAVARSRPDGQPTTYASRLSTDRAYRARSGCRYHSVSSTDACPILPFGGCASTACGTGRTGGWFSGWGTGGANAFTVGLHRTCGECADRTPGASPRPQNPGPAPSAEPASELQVPPSGAPR